MGHRVLIIGRGHHADIRLRDRSVSRLHAELVVGSDGTLHVADRASANGTWVEEDGRWRRCTQRTVVRADRVRLGDAELTVSELLDRAPEPPPAGEASVAREQPDAPDSGPARGDGLPGGRVRRNPETGEIIVDR